MGSERSHGFITKRVRGKEIARGRCPGPASFDTDGEIATVVFPLIPGRRLKKVSFHQARALVRLERCGGGNLFDSDE